MYPGLHQEIIAILTLARDRTIATIRQDGSPHATAVSHAGDGLANYFGCSAASQKAYDIAQDRRVALTVTLPYRNWSEIRGLSISGRADQLTDASEIRHAAGLLLQKFPESVAEYASGDLQSIALVRVTPEVIRVVDHRQGIGRAQIVAVAQNSTPSPL